MMLLTEYKDGLNDLVTNLTAPQNEKEKTSTSFILTS